MYSPKERENFYRSALNRMIQEGLQEKHAAWAAAHETTADRELAQYIRDSAERLKHTPHEGEIWGSPMIAERFGSWEKAIEAAGLEPNPGKPHPGKFRIVVEETAYQTKYYQENRRKKKAEKAEKIRQAREKKAANDAAWQEKKAALAKEKKQQQQEKDRSFEFV